MSESKFGHISQKSVLNGDSRAEFECLELAIDPVPVLIVAPASTVNAQFTNAVLRQASRRSAGRQTAQAINANREKDIPLYAKYVVKGWRDVFDIKGKEVPFSLADCQEFLQALPDHVFDELRMFASENTNFISAEEELLDPEEVKGN